MEANNTIQQQFPWLQQNNTLPNYFLHAGATLGSAHATVFLHQHRSAGGVVSDCLETVALKHHLVNGPRMTSDERLKWDQSNSGKNIATKYDVHRGQYVLGLCDGYADNRPCFQFSMFREPMARAVSSYRYCQSALADEMCKVLNANGVSLKQWILHHGSLLFQQLTFNSDWCSSTNHLAPAKDDHRGFFSDVDFLLKPEESPCWYRHKLRLEQLSPTEREHLLDYILEHMDRWFSVIGLVEDFDESIEMLEHVFRIPLTNCSFRKSDVDKIAEEDIVDNRANVKKHLESYVVGDDDADDDDDNNDPDYLVYDYEVRKALDADFKIHKKAVRIFQLQRQVLFNKVKPAVVR